jgi:hypothetical protein
MKKLTVLIIALLNVCCIHAQQTDWSIVENIFGKKGIAQGDYFKITFPRSDLTVKINDVTIDPSLALTSWIGYMKMDTEVMIMGDLVLLDSELPKVISKLSVSGMNVTAIHNHLISETPAIKYMHFEGTGSVVKLSQIMKSVLALTGTPLTPPSTNSQQQNMDWSKVEAILGKPGTHKGVVDQFAFPRAESVTENGMLLPPILGMATAINFQVAGDKTVIAGDFVLLSNEVNPVLKSLSASGVTVTAVHNHMLNESPRLFMMHFWAVGDPAQLAGAVKAALDLTNIKN